MASNGTEDATSVLRVYLGKPQGSIIVLKGTWFATVTVLIWSRKSWRTIFAEYDMNDQCCGWGVETNDSTLGQDKGVRIICINTPLFHYCPRASSNRSHKARVTILHGMTDPLRAGRSCKRLPKAERSPINGNYPAEIFYSVDTSGRKCVEDKLDCKFRYPIFNHAGVKDRQERDMVIGWKSWSKARLGMTRKWLRALNTPRHGESGSVVGSECYSITAEKLSHRGCTLAQDWGSIPFKWSWVYTTTWSQRLLERE